MRSTSRSLTVAAALAGVFALALAGPAARPAAARPLDINSASREQLMTLPGIGKDEAERIAAGRPYLSKASLVTDKVLPAGVYQTIRHRIVAIPKPALIRRPAGASAAR